MKHDDARDAKRVLRFRAIEVFHLGNILETETSVHCQPDDQAAVGPLLVGEDPQCSGSIVVPLLTPTGSSRMFIEAALLGLRRISKSGFQYAKAGGRAGHCPGGRRGDAGNCSPKCSRGLPASSWLQSMRLISAWPRSPAVGLIDGEGGCALGGEAGARDASLYDRH